MSPLLNGFSKTSRNIWASSQLSWRSKGLLDVELAVGSGSVQNLCTWVQTFGIQDRGCGCSYALCSSVTVIYCQTGICTIQPCALTASVATPIGNLVPFVW